MIILILLGIAAGICLLAILVCGLLNAFNVGCGDWGIGAAAATILAVFFVAVFLTCFAYWHRAGQKTSILHKQYGVTFTQEEVFWTDTLIEQSIIDLKTTKAHIEIEGLKGE